MEREEARERWLEGSGGGLPHDGTSPLLGSTEKA